MPAWIAPAAIAAGSMIYGALSQKNANKNQDKQYEQNKELMGLSYEHQRDLYDYSYSKNTPEMQVKNLKKAGLNPALMYGLGGQGGATTGSGGANVEQANATAGSQATGAASGTMNMAIGMAKAQSEIELNKSVANLNNTEAEKKAGVDTKLQESQINKLLQETTNEQVKESLLRIERDIQLYSAADQIKATEENAKKIAEEVNNLSRTNEIGEETKQSIIAEIKARAIGAQIENRLKSANINLTNQQIEGLKNKILQDWQQISINWGNMKNSQKANEIQAFSAKVKAAYPSIGEMGGRILNDVIYDVSEELDKILE